VRLLKRKKQLLHQDLLDRPHVVLWFHLGLGDLHFFGLSVLVAHLHVF
jgi:hypothetical protein